MKIYILASWEKDTNDIWVGFNARHYDQYIAKAIIAGFRPQQMNDWIIDLDRMGWEAR